MNHLKEIWRRLLYLIRRREMDADVAEEMRLHLELRAAKHATHGAPADQATAAARREFGNITRLKERSRDAWGWGWLDSLQQDLRYGWRNLMGARGFTATAVLSLALGIGANTAIFSVVNAMMLRSLPVPDPHRLAGLSIGDNHDNNTYLTNPLWEAIRDHQNAFSGAFAYSSAGFDLAQGGERQVVAGIWVSGDFFDTLSVPPYRGRTLNRDDDLRGGGKRGTVAVISYSFWRTHFGGDAAIVGKSIYLNGIQFEIVGVTPPSFTGVDIDRPFSVAIPLACEPRFHTDGNALDNRSWWWLRVVGRLTPGISIEQANERLKTVAPEIMRQTLPEWDSNAKASYLRQGIQLQSAATGFSGMKREHRLAMFAMMGVVAMVLLIACANIANLLLARAAARQQEICVRLAIGAGRRRLIRQLLTESLLLASLGIPGGLLIAHWGSRLLVRLISTGKQPLEMDVSMDATVLFFTIAISVATGLLFGFVPALRATRISTNEVLKQTTRGAGSGGSRFKLGRALVAGQIALSLALLVAAGMFVATLRNLANVSLGFNHRNILVVDVDTRGKVPKPQRVDHYQQLQDRLQSLPGVVSVGNSMITPISGQGWNGMLAREGDKLAVGKKSRENMAWYNRVSPGFFQTMEMPLLVGRDFTTHDTLSTPAVIILGEKTARDLFGKESPIGKRVTRDAGPNREETFEVIGVVPDAKYLRISEEPRRTAYFPMAQDDSSGEQRTFLIRSTSSSFEAVIPAIRSLLVEVAPQDSMDFKSLETLVRNSLSAERVTAGLVSFFSALALALAVVGLYGVTSYAAAQRKGEIGIRMALGAQRASVVWLVLRDVVVILALGSTLGIAMSFGAGKLIGSLLYGIKPGDPFTLIAAALVLAIAGALAGFVPALRASRLDPAIALRYE